MIWIVIIAGALYIFLIIALFIGWEELTPFHNFEQPYTTFVSVVIPMRNEELHIKALLRDLSGQNYPNNLFEIIIVDDHSGDHSLSETLSQQNEHINILELPIGTTGKKKALQYGIEKSRGELILTSDADCSVGDNWIASHAGYFEKYKPVMMLGPVCGKYHHAFSKMQALEMFSLLGSTAGAASLNHAIMCNGANLSFSMKIYPEIKQVYNNQYISSGDDMFVLQQLKKKYRKRIHFIKSSECVVQTNLSDTLVSFFKQRRRWAAKAVFYSDPDIILSGLIVLVVNLLLLITLAFGIVTIHFGCFILLFLAKWLIDALFLYRITRFFGEKRLLPWFPLVQSFYFLYVCFTVISSIIFSTTWKERAIKH